MPELKSVTTARSTSIRTRLLVAFLSMVTLPIVIIGAFLVISSVQGGRQQLSAQLETILAYKQTAIDEWLLNLKIEVGDALFGGVTSQELEVLLGTSPEDDGVPERAGVGEKLVEHLRYYVDNAQRFDEFILLDLEGSVVLATGSTPVGENLADEPFFLPGISEPTIPPPAFSPALGFISIAVVKPIYAEDGKKIGLIVGRANKMPLNNILLDYSGLSDTGDTFLVGGDYTFLTRPRFPVEQDYVNRTEGVVAAVSSQRSGNATYTNYRGVTVFGVYRWVPELQAALIAEQDLTAASRSTNAVVAVNVSIALAAILVATIAALAVTSDIATPVADLAETAIQVTQGELGLAVSIERDDEIGSLAQAFNSMTTQLRQTLDGLEQEVADRTIDLEVRSAYLQASAEVGRAINTILDPSELIQQVVELIRERFALYYVGLFQVDDAGEWAVLQAGTGTAGQVMLARGHRIPVGSGMIGWSVAHAEPRIASEVGEDAVRLATEELPETRSEAALPLRSRGQVIGALTIQSVLTDAFTEDNIAVLQVMADQVAVALDNTRLYAETQEALASMQRVYGEQSLEVWREMLRERADMSVRSDALGVSAAEQEWRPEMAQALQQRQTVRAVDDRQSLAIPIKVRDTVVGVLDTYKPEAAGGWSSEEIQMIEEITDQLGIALESAQFFGETRQRAETERLVGEVTAQMRETLDIDTVLQTAAREMRRILDLAEVEIRLGDDAEGVGS